MKKQKGAALIVVLSLLTVSLMVGLSSMQSSQIDERLSGNYRAQSDAQMAAEAVASYAVGLLPGLNGSIFVDFNPESIFGWDDFSSSAVVDFSSAVPVDDRVYSCSAGVSCEFRYVGVNSFNSIYGLLPGDYVVSMGAVESSFGIISQSEPLFVGVRLSGFGWLSAVMAPDVLNVFTPPASQAKFVGGEVPAFTVSGPADKALVEESGANIEGDVRAGFPPDSMFADPNNADGFVNFINMLSGAAVHVEGPVT